MPQGSLPKDDTTFFHGNSVSGKVIGGMGIWWKVTKLKIGGKLILVENKGLVESSLF